MKLSGLFLFVFTGLLSVCYSQDTVRPAIEIPEGITAEGVPAIPGSFRERVRPYTLHRVAYLQDWHPRKKEIVITTQLGATSQAHIVSQPGGMRRQVTFFEEGVNQCLFDPQNGDFLIVQKDQAGDELYQLYRLDLLSGKTSLLSGGGKTYNYGLRWNRKGDRLFYISRAANQSYSEVYRVDPKDPGSGIPLLRFEGPNWDLQDIAGDENTLLLSAPHNGSNALNSLWLYDVGARTKKIILPTEGKTGAYYNATFSRDARGIYLLTNQNSEHSQLAYYDLAKKKLQVLTAFDWDVRTASLSPDGSLLAFTVNEAGNTKAYIYQTATKACTAVQGLPAGFMAGLAWAKDSRSLGFQFSTANASSDVYVWDVRAGKAEPWVKNELGFDASVLYPPRPVKWRSFDGREISGFLYPASKKFKGKRPVIISIHGGPVMQALPLYDPIANFYTNELGVAVIYPNIRGSAGFGKAFTELDNGLKKEDAVADIGALLTWIAGQPGLDAKRVMVTGGSYGGYMTYRAAAKYGDQIRCAVAGFSSPDLLSANGVDSAYRAFFSAEYGDTSQHEVRDYLRKVSPRNNADKIKAPILIVNGKNDPRVPVDAVQEMVAALRKNGCTVWHLVANDEGHGFVKQKNEAFLLYTTALFIERYLLNDQ